MIKINKMSNIINKILLCIRLDFNLGLGIKDNTDYYSIILTKIYKRF